MHCATRMTAENAPPGEMTQTQKNEHLRFHLYEASRRDRLTGTEKQAGG